MFFDGSFFKKKICWHLEFLINQIFVQRFISCFKIISIKIIKYKNNFNYCWNYGPSTLLLHFIKYRPDQLNSNHTKIAVNSTIQFLKAALKEMPAKSLNFFGPLTTKWRPCKMFVKLNGKHLLMANIFKLHEYQTFGLMKMHNMH